MSKIRILHIHTLPVVSGSGLNTFLSMNGLDRDVYEPELACAPGGRLVDLVQDHGMVVRPFENLVQPLRPMQDTMALIRLTRFMRQHRYQVVHTHNSKAGFIGRLAATLAKVPVVVHTVHGFAFHDQEPAWRQTMFRTLERRAARWCHRMVFISAPLMQWASKERILCPGGHEKVYSGIELDRFRPADKVRRDQCRKRWGLGPEHKVVGIVSKLWPGKGHELLLRACAVLLEQEPQVRLMVVGEGDLQPELETLAKQLGIMEQVVFTGFLEDVAEAIAAMDVSVLPSLFEGMGRVLLESMAMGVPVVASDVGGIPDVVRHAETGLLVPVGDEKALIGALRSLLADGEMAKSMGRAGRVRVNAHFGAETMVASLETIYQTLLREKGIWIHG